MLLFTLRSWVLSRYPAVWWLFAYSNLQILRLPKERRKIDIVSGLGDWSFLMNGKLGLGLEGLRLERE